MAQDLPPIAGVPTPSAMPTQTTEAASVVEQGSPFQNALQNAIGGSARENLATESTEPADGKTSQATDETKDRKSENDQDSVDALQTMAGKVVCIPSIDLASLLAQGIKAAAQQVQAEGSSGKQGPVITGIGTSAQQAGKAGSPQTGSALPFAIMEAMTASRPAMGTGLVALGLSGFAQDSSSRNTQAIAAPENAQPATGKEASHQTQAAASVGKTITNPGSGFEIPAALLAADELNAAELGKQEGSTAIMAEGNSKRQALTQTEVRSAATPIPDEKYVQQSPSRTQQSPAKPVVQSSGNHSIQPQMTNGTADASAKLETLKTLESITVQAAPETIAAATDRIAGGSDESVRTPSMPGTNRTQSADAKGADEYASQGGGFGQRDGNGGKTPQQAPAGSSAQSERPSSGIDKAAGQFTSAQPTATPMGTKSADGPGSLPIPLPHEVSRAVLDQIVKGITLTVTDTVQEMRVTLKPESLGEVVLKMKMENGRLQTQIDVAQPAVKAAVESQITDLRQALVDRGIDVQRIDVVASGQSANVADGRTNRDTRFRQKGSRRNDPVDQIEEIQQTRSLGYNTLEVIM